MHNSYSEEADDFAFGVDVAFFEKAISSVATLAAAEEPQEALVFVSHFEAGNSPLGALPTPIDEQPRLYSSAWCYLLYYCQFDLLLLLLRILPSLFHPQAI